MEAITIRAKLVYNINLLALNLDFHLVFFAFDGVKNNVMLSG